MERFFARPEEFHLASAYGNPVPLAELSRAVHRDLIDRGPVGAVEVFEDDRISKDCQLRMLTRNKIFSQDDILLCPSANIELLLWAQENLLALKLAIHHT